MNDKKIEIAMAIADIITINEYICDFWGNYEGDELDRTAYKMAICHLDRIVGFSKLLSKELERVNSSECSDTELILAWATLGALVEGTLHWFLCVYNDAFQPDAAFEWGEPKEPERLILNDLIDMYKHMYCNIENKNHKHKAIGYLNFVKMQSNKIHFYDEVHPAIGSADIWQEAVFCYRLFLLILNKQVAYPEEHPDCPVNETSDLEQKISFHVDQIVALYR